MEMLLLIMKVWMESAAAFFAQLLICVFAILKVSFYSFKLIHFQGWWEGKKALSAQNREYFPGDLMQIPFSQ